MTASIIHGKAFAAKIKEDVAKRVAILKENNDLIPGLAVVLTVGSQAALFALPASSGLLPEWTADPDPTGQSKLTTLARELGMILLPEDYTPEDFKAA